MIVSHTALIGYGLRVSTRELGYLRRENRNHAVHDLFPSNKFTRLSYAMGDTSAGVNICFVTIAGTVASVEDSGLGLFDPNELKEAIDDTAYEELQTVALESQIHRPAGWYLFLYR
ncbi:MAG: hypothetical protein H9W81_09835 [Enterococcus sp.]|nr:hypothetical protein [Enterococcus sp.]